MKDESDILLMEIKEKMPEPLKILNLICIYPMTI